ncbi:MAG TPA: response regulator transcription factor [Candidatus Polarisedimenticolaceae bacterium]
MAGKILVVDDERDIVGALQHVLTREGFQVAEAYDGREALEAIRRERPDLVLLDVMLPEVSGVEVLKSLRGGSASPALPVILLTARKDEIDRVLGFELGADDYVTKPFSPREIVLRVKAVLKRGAGGTEDDARTLRWGPIEVDLDNHRAAVAGRSLGLTITEFRLLADLVKARGRVRTREALLSEVWGYDAEVMSRTVDTHMRRLRHKLGDASPWLGTVRGVGYRVQDPGPA